MIDTGKRLRLEATSEVMTSSRSADNDPNASGSSLRGRLRDLMDTVLSVSEVAEEVLSFEGDEREMLLGILERVARGDHFSPIFAINVNGRVKRGALLDDSDEIQTHDRAMSEVLIIPDWQKQDQAMAEVMLDPQVVLGAMANLSQSPKTSIHRQHFSRRYPRVRRLCVGPDPAHPTSPSLEVQQLIAARH